MKPSIQTLGQILYSPSQYIIPVFQRQYRWETPQWAKLWESLLEIQQPDKKGNHFMGFLVFIPELAQPGQNTRFHIIDGQQRITTLTLFLAAIRNVAHANGVDDLASEIHEYYLVHPLKKGSQHYRLLPKEREQDKYLAVIDQRATADCRAKNAVQFFESKIIEYCDGDFEKLRSLFNTVYQRLEFMCATLETENAYNIFKSLNSTGVPLSQSDLVRNFIFMHVKPEDSDDFDENHWSKLEADFSDSDGKLDEARFGRFFRDYLISIRNAYLAPTETFAVFEARYEATDFDPIELTDTLKKYSGYYAIISGVKPDPSPAITAALHHLNSLQSSTTYPLVLSFFHLRNEKVIDADQLACAVRMLAGFIFRRFICGESSRAYGKMFIRDFTNEPDLIAALESYLNWRGWPKDDRFINSFVRFPLYTRGYTKYVLVSLERARGHKEPADLGKTEVEHIMPQTLSDEWRKALGDDYERVYNEWLHTPGNLSLSAYNLPLWNHEFSKKKSYYKDSNVVITKEVATYDEWCETQILERGTKLANEASKIWIGPSH